MPDLFSVGPSSSKTNSKPEAAPRVVLPKDLPGAMRHLDDRELDLLLRAAKDEARRRGRFAANRDAFAAASADTAQKEASTPRS